MSAPRLLAVLFAGLVASTETVAKLGPEAGEAWLQRFLAVMREALAACGLNARGDPRDSMRATGSSLRRLRPGQSRGRRLL